MKLQDAVWPALSDAVQLTLESPTPTDDPDEGVHETEAPGPPPLNLGAKVISVAFPSRATTSSGSGHWSDSGPGGRVGELPHATAATHRRAAVR
jgi:hypothetical protein